MERVAVEQRSIRYIAAAELRATKISQTNVSKERSKLASDTSYELLLLLQQQKYTWLQYKTPQVQASGTNTSIFSDEVHVEGGHRNCCRFATLTGVHQGAHICHANYWINGQFRS